MSISTTYSSEDDTNVVNVSSSHTSFKENEHENVSSIATEGGVQEKEAEGPSEQIDRIPDIRDSPSTSLKKKSTPLSRIRKENEHENVSSIATEGGVQEKEAEGPSEQIDRIPDIRDSPSTSLKKKSTPLSRIRKKVNISILGRKSRQIIVHTIGSDQDNATYVDDNIMDMEQEQQLPNSQANSKEPTTELDMEQEQQFSVNQANSKELITDSQVYVVQDLHPVIRRIVSEELKAQKEKLISPPLPVKETMDVSPLMRVSAVLIVIIGIAVLIRMVIRYHF